VESGRAGSTDMPTARRTGSKLHFPSYAMFLMSLRHRPPERQPSDRIVEILLEPDWRRERDSNPRKDCSFTGLANLRFRPLSHLSEAQRFNPAGRLRSSKFSRESAGFSLFAR
jgi:hypothetical protein